ncbi:MAG: HEAT repeat domain-containing protein [Kofleriaceae bacterium]
MKIPGLIAVLALCSLPAAHGADTDPSPTLIEQNTLTRMDTVPTKDEVLTATGSVERLTTLATTATIPFGVQLRAIRALPHFCIPDCKPNLAGQNHVAHTAALTVIASVPSSDRTGQSILRLRAAIEALGLIRSGLNSDIALLVPFLDDASRDLRVTTARALATTCNTLALDPLRNRAIVEPVDSVKQVIGEATRRLNECPPPL